MKTISASTIALICGLLMVGSFVSTDIYLPSLPAIQTSFNTTQSMIQMSLSIYLLGFGISQYVMGILSDRFGRRPILITGMLIYSIGSLLLLISPSAQIILVSRLIQGLGIGAAGALSRVILRDVFTGKALARAFSLTAIIIAMTPAIAPALGGVIQHTLGYQANFLFMLLFGLLLLTIVYFFLHETNQTKDKTATQLSALLAKTKLIFSHHSLMKNIFINSLIFTIIMINAAFFPFVMTHTYHLSAMTFGFLILIMSSGLAVGMYLNSEIIKYIDIRYMPYIGAFLLLGTSLLLATVSHYMTPPLLFLMFSVICINLGVAFILPNIAAAIFQPFPQMAGFVGASYGAIQILSSALGSAMIALLNVRSILEYAIVILVISLLTLTCSFFTEPEKEMTTV